MFFKFEFRTLVYLMAQRHGLTLVLIDCAANLGVCVHRIATSGPG